MKAEERIRREGGALPNIKTKNAIHNKARHPFSPPFLINVRSTPMSESSADETDDPPLLLWSIMSSTLVIVSPKSPDASAHTKKKKQTKTKKKGEKKGQ